MVSIDLSGKNVLITGAGGGIGGGIADVFAKAGAKVYVADWKMENAEKKAAEIVKNGGNAVPVMLDVTKKDNIDAVVDKIVADDGKIDNLVTCAGACYNIPFMQTTEDQLRTLLDINLISVNNTCQAVLKHMIPKKYGKIVNIQSSASREGHPLNQRSAALVLSAEDVEPVGSALVGNNENILAELLLHLKAELHKSRYHRRNDVTSGGTDRLSANREALVSETIKAPKHKGKRHTKGLSRAHRSVANNRGLVSVAAFVAPPGQNLVLLSAERFNLHRVCQAFRRPLQARRRTRVSCPCRFPLLQGCPMP